MKIILGTTAAFALAAAIFSNESFTTPDDYALRVPRPTTGTATIYDTLAKGLAVQDCQEAFARRDRSLDPARNALCTRIFAPSIGFRLTETQNAQGERKVEAYPLEPTP